MKNLNQKSKRNEKGITLIVLVITIIVLLILAGVSITMLSGDRGILNVANESKIETVVGTVKEQVKLLQAEKIIKEEKVTTETLLADGKVKRTVQMGENDKYYMYYALKENSFEGMQGLGKGDLIRLRDVFLIDDDLNVKYIASNGKEYGNETKEKILEDETEIRFKNKAFSQYISKISGVSEEEMKFKWMKNQTSLTITDPAVNSLEDLVFFPNLEKITLDNLKLNNLNGIENCKKLKEFYSERNSMIEDYQILSKMENLVFFQRKGICDFDNVIDSIKNLEKLRSVTITQANITNMKRIEELNNNIISLSLGVNKIKKIEGLKNKINLLELILNQNDIDSMNGLENCINLKTLNLYSNKITTIENTNKMVKLYDLNLGFNNIENIIPLSENNELVNVNLVGNKNIESNRNNYSNEDIEKLKKIEKILEKGGTINLDPDKLKLFTKYKKIEIYNRNINNLEYFEGLTELTYLGLGRNNITLKDKKSQDILEKMKNLEYLDLYNNNLENITSINKLPKLKTLFLQNSNANLTEIEDIISNLTNLRISNDEIESLLNCNTSKITELNLQYSNIDKVPDLSKFTNLTRLSLSYISKISNLEEISKISSLQSLDLEYDNLRGRMIDFSKLTNLTYLNLSKNTLWTEDLENLKALKNNTNLKINLDNNSIIDTTALLELNQNTKISLKNNINLSQDSKDKLKAKFGNNVTF